MAEGISLSGSKRNYAPMTRRICITGPEATGKSSLAETLSNELRCPWVPEYARVYLQKLNRPYKEEDLETILLGQTALEDRIASTPRGNGKMIFCDTGPEVIWVWSFYKYGRVSPLIDEIARQRKYDLTLLMETDLPWTPDPHRENPSSEDRSELFRLFEKILVETNQLVARISGTGSSRIHSANTALQKFL